MINLKLNPMGEVIFFSIKINEMMEKKLFGEKMQKNITNYLVK